MSDPVSHATCCRSARGGSLGANGRFYAGSLAVVCRLDHLCDLGLELRNEVLVSWSVLVEASDNRLCLGCEIGVLGHAGELVQEKARILFFATQPTVRLQRSAPSPRSQPHSHRLHGSHAGTS